MKKYISTNKENTYLKVETYYNKGGMNVFTYREEKRGYYLSVSPVEKRGCLESYVAFSGVKQIVLEVKRQSAKQAAVAECKAADMEKSLIAYVAEKNGLEVRESA